MRVSERETGDGAKLEELISAEKHADQRDRYRIALLALRGLEKLQIAGLLGVCKRTVEDWAYAYRDGGIAALKMRPRGGSKPKLSGAAAAKLAARLDTGPTEQDKVCTLRGRDVQRIAREELGADVSLATVYRTLHRLGYSCLSPRPRHEKQDLAAQEKFKNQSAPLLSAPSPTS